MKYHIYCNIKTQKDYYADAILEFEKRLSAYCSTDLHISSTLEFPKELNTNNHSFILIRGGISTYSSEEFSQALNDLQHSGKSFVHVVIGFDEYEFYTALSNYQKLPEPTKLSLTRNNLSNETLTLLFYEQLYRAYTILQGKTYHK